MLPFCNKNSLKKEEEIDLFDNHKAVGKLKLFFSFEKNPKEFRVSEYSVITIENLQF